MTTVPNDTIGKLVQPPQETDDIAISGKGQIDSTPPTQGIGPSSASVALAITGKGQAPRAGIPWDEAK